MVSQPSPPTLDDLIVNAIQIWINDNSNLQRFPSTLVDYKLSQTLMTIYKHGQYKVRVS